MVKSKDGFILKYGNGKTILTLKNALFELSEGTNFLVLDDGTKIEFYYTRHLQQSNRDGAILDKYSDYGVRKIEKGYFDKIFIGELTEEQKKYVE